MNHKMLSTGRLGGTSQGDIESDGSTDITSTDDWIQVTSQAGTVSLPAEAAPVTSGQVKGLCLVCGDKSLAIHYGVLSCDGCKSFFSRAVVNHATFNCPTKSCRINRATRNRCMYCRWKKCIAVGMSKDGSKLGRRSNKMKQEMGSIDASVSSLTSKNVAESSIDHPLSIVGEGRKTDNGNLTDTVMSDFPAQSRAGSLDGETELAHWNTKEPTRDTHGRSSVANHETHPENSQTWAIYPSLDDDTKPTSSGQNDLEFSNEVFRLWKSNFSFPARDGSGSVPVVDSASLERIHCKLVQEREQAFPIVLNHLETTIKSMVRFVKLLPDFRRLEIADQIILVKENLFEMISLQAAMLAGSNQHLVVLGSPTFIIPLQLIADSAFGNIMKDTFSVAQRMQYLGLGVQHACVLGVIAILATDRNGLINVAEIEGLRSKAVASFQQLLVKTHPCNHLEVFAKAMLLLPTLREINCDHSKLVLAMSLEMPENIPDLHKEVFYL